LQGDERLVALTRRGNQAAFEALVYRYQSRLLGFCRQMLGSTEDAEDVLQEVFVAAYNAMVADERSIAVRPWLYRIARNRCLNQLRKPTADGQDTMDTHPHLNGVTTLERVQTREEFRNLLSDVGRLPETQRSALLLREVDAMSYEEIAQAMDTTVPGIKSLLVRARIALAESSQARQLTCGEVRVELAEAAEGLAKVSGPVRRHIKDCEPCHEFRAQLRSNGKTLAALFPIGPLVALKALLAGKLGGAAGGSAASGGAAGAGAGGGTAGAGAAGAGAAGATAAGAGGSVVGGAAIGGAAAVGGGGALGGAAGALGAALGSKAAAGLATAALLTAGAVEVKHVTDGPKEPTTRAAEVAVGEPPAPRIVPAVTEPKPVDQPVQEEEPVVVEPVPVEEPSPDPAAGEQHKTHKSEPMASANTNEPQPESGDSGTGTAQAEPGAETEIDSGCDADGDGVTDPDADAGCTTDGATTEIVTSG
jgi:RNA polymerase sigma factor (sigma-70 family)